MSMSMQKTMGLCLVMLLAVPAHAVEDFGFICERPGEPKRQIHVAYENPSSRLPCEVRYFKGDKMQVLWTSANTPGYCGTKAREFADKQRGWGWQCQEVLYQDEVDAGAGSAR